MKTSPGKQLLSLLVMPAIFGVLAALVATAFLKLVELGQEFLYGVIPHSLGFTETPWWLAGIFLVLAGLLIVLIRKMPGHAGPSPLTGFHFDTPGGFAPAILLTAFVSLIAGASLGPEAPLIILGTTLAYFLTRNKDEQTRKAAMFIAGAAAIGAVFGNPFITAFMILEFAALGVVPYLLVIPVMTALAASYVVQIGIWNFPGFAGHPLAVHGIPDYTTINPGDFLGAVLVAVIAGLIALSTRALGGRVQAFSDKQFAPTLFISVAIIIALVFVGQTFFGVELNQLLFSGNSGMSGLIAESSVFVVIFVLLAKTAIYSLTLGSGFRGGPIFPITFLGVAVGVLVSLHFPGSPVSAFAAAGIAGASAAFLKLPATSALLAAVLIGGAGEAIAPVAITGAVVGFIIRAIADGRAPQETPAHS
ncbi:chloride channel protein [Aurantimicrobium minutum]|uniref:chloride channel protein n=1 Tax=Aurantimicrobium minutum TaxID=708131 RepID=UPI00248E1FE0|nr:chloride channel protein [Aurantimicrobium minutum]